jgi:hypothetical protein
MMAISPSQKSQTDERYKNKQFHQVELMNNMKINNGDFTNNTNNNNSMMTTTTMDINMNQCALKM